MDQPRSQQFWFRGGSGKGGGLSLNLVQKTKENKEITTLLCIGCEGWTRMFHSVLSKNFPQAQLDKSIAVRLLTRPPRKQCFSHLFQNTFLSFCLSDFSVQTLTELSASPAYPWKGSKSASEPFPSPFFCDQAHSCASVSTPSSSSSSLSPSFPHAHSSQTQIESRS